MSRSTSPPPIKVDLADGDHIPRIHTQLWLWSMTGVTILLTAWLISLGPLPGIIGTVVAKHVLVALLVMAREVNAQEPAEV
jgi:hypothetical protein